jgi:tRNA (guanine9-N1)-methyltransferase
MLKWLETEDWGQAFLTAIPKRKAGKLRGEDGEAEAEAEHEDAVDGEEGDGGEDDGSAGDEDGPQQTDGAAIEEAAGEDDRTIKRRRVDDATDA